MKKTYTGIFALTLVILYLALASAINLSEIISKMKDERDILNKQIQDQQQELNEESRKDVQKAEEALAKTIAFQQSLVCLANNIYYEAASEPYEGKVAVAQVTINRTHDIDRPKTICGVVYEPSQFTWTRHQLKKVNEKLYIEAVNIARRVLTKKERSAIIGKDVTYYHRVDVHPDWADEHEQVAQIGLHVFYKRGKINVIQ
jgi:spore germination cell wall hydrolase CwlJ-like protein